MLIIIIIGTNRKKIRTELDITTPIWSPTISFIARKHEYNEKAHNIEIIFITAIDKIINDLLFIYQLNINEIKTDRREHRSRISVHSASVSK